MSKRDIIYASPPPVGRPVLDELKAVGLRNNLAAYWIQKQLHQLFIQPDFGALPEGTRVQLRRLHSIAFEGYSLPPGEIEAIGGNLRQEKSVIQQETKENLGQLSAMLQKQSASWQKIEEGASELGFNGNGDMLRIW